MLRLVEVEFRKLRGSLVLLLIALPPLLPGLLIPLLTGIPPAVCL